MEIKNLYQTLVDNGNPKNVEQNGPFECQKPNAWFGRGFYFWDTFIENAHWWGENSYNNCYIITCGICDFDRDKCFDLTGSNTSHNIIFNNALKKIQETGYLERVTVPRVIEFLKMNTEFTFEAIRGYGVNSLSPKGKFGKYVKRAFFKEDGYQYLDYLPAIQVCLLRKKSLNYREHKIIYPEIYANEYYL